MPKKIDLTNQKFGYWTVIREATKEEKNNRPGAYWVCICECGTTKIINGQTLRNGESMSCGCKTGEIIAKKNNSRAKDLTGMRFGRLVVIERDFEEEKKHPSKGSTYWKCLCDCGNIKTILKNSLISGATKSCGCLRKQVSQERLSELSSLSYKDEIGNRYGKLVVVEKVSTPETSNRAGVYWKCICDCGNEKIVNGYDLRKGMVSSCGCLGNSKGEFQIEKILKENKILFQKEFSQKIENRIFRFDFFINNSYFIEFDGIQHYKSSEFFGGKDYLIYIQENDKIKNNWCKKNNIPLIRIPYTHLNKLCIEDLLLETSNFII